ncbi:MAG: lysophospholipid acyltransferase family protein [Victivallaceae bacterium]|nr:lysophospholipid acyltransferase family protein [Victivallaceae bacterium]NLK82725.1 1-acyl-sn-glycerol-3-phosphate acyltransferase [Lentisphaerota bacterium]MDD3116344.1 lysophospholipid acyltransferase family protein [Victivallaceae bacterium]MDD3704162.1 lysophospholipid acyltransferase family protein [Victivallaceae bacterium]MDD4317303.1 lysophospholipid acyltransferase family protein [Victivallaceae bacterium]
MIQLKRISLTFFIYLSMLFWTVLYCSVAIWVYLVALFCPKRISGQIMRYVILYYGQTMIHIAIRPFIVAKYEDLAGGDTRAGIYIFNHRSASDPFLMSIFGISAIQLVNGWPMRLPFFGYFARSCEYIDATKIDYESAKAHITSLLKRGVSVMAFPEGTRSDGRVMNHFHSGIFKLAMDTGALIYPCAIVGNEYLPDRKFRFPQGGKIMVRRLKAIENDEIMQCPTAFVLKNKIKDIIQQETAKMDKLIDHENQI